MAHGTYDPVVRFERAQQSRDALVKLGYQVDWHAYPMQHTVCGEEVVAIGAFLRRVLDRPDATRSSTRRGRARASNRG